MMPQDKTLFFFYENPDDLRHGYAAEYLDGPRGLKATYPNLKTLNLAAGDLPSEQIDLLIVEDDFPDMQRLINAGSSTKGIRSFGVCYGPSILGKLLETMEHASKIMTLDFQLQKVDPAGMITKDLLKPTFEMYQRLDDNPLWKNTVVLGITYHTKRELSGKLLDGIHRRGDSVFEKKNAFWEILPDILWDALSRYQMRCDNTTLKLALDKKQKEYARLELLNHTGHLIGVSEVLEAVADSVEPFFSWIRGDYDKWPDHLKPEFVTSILLEGPPGGGKSSLCEAVAKAFASDAVLPQSMGPTALPGRWRKELCEYVGKLYRKAFNRQVVVIRADDLRWPASGRMLQQEFAADWTGYLNVFRSLLDDAARINRGKSPASEELRDLRNKKLQGKVLWLFARNTDEDVGPMFAPFRDKLMTFRMDFPKNRDDRKDILIHYAEKKGCEFEEDALEMALGNLSSYDGRDLIGDRMTPRGFLPYAIRKVQNRESQRGQQGHKDLNMTITKNIVVEWFSGPEHKEILRRLRKQSLRGDSTNDAFIGISFEGTEAGSTKPGDYIWNAFSEGLELFSCDRKGKLDIVRLMGPDGEIETREISTSKKKPALYTEWITKLGDVEMARAVVARVILEQDGNFAGKEKEDEARKKKKRKKKSALDRMGSFIDDDHRNSVRVQILKGYKMLPGISVEGVRRGDYDDLMRRYFSDLPLSGCLFKMRNG